MTALASGEVGLAGRVKFNQTSTRMILMSDDAREIHAYEVSDTTNMLIGCGPPQRAWMDATTERFAYRCLPMVIANQAGWMIENPVDFTASWNGGRQPEDLWIDFGRRQSTNEFAFQVCVGPTKNEGD